MSNTGEMERVFRYFDEDGDGKISCSELRRVLCLVDGGGEMLEQLKEAEMAIEALDSDGDGLLGLNDLIGFMESGEEEEKVKDLKEAFDLYDVERCGFITPKNLKRMLSKLGDSEVY
ncbi:EF hand calcium-binding family protein [Quillaja saponaria]|uniref:EF hand calcium-binding family protein n=1 Tax=Quillaja saponaria TaxID=32244 RepID=A0AAD7P8J2_QUISA|nr:EF hand calcium-binding family protein [Quillaja saponaria]